MTKVVLQFNLKKILTKTEVPLIIAMINPVPINHKPILADY